MPDFRALIDRAAARYLLPGQRRSLAWGLARGKLAGDPVFCSILKQGLIGQRTRILDLGCGKGLFESLLLCAQAAPELLPPGTPRLPAALSLRGIELDAGDVAHAHRALGPAAEIHCGDITATPFPDADLVLILDVLHYIPPAAQEDVLRRAFAALPPGGRLLLRVGDADGGPRYRWSQRVDQLVVLLRCGRWQPLWGRRLADWRALLAACGFTAEARPMSAGTAFANVLLVADRPARG